ncbi:unnamed protein product, partial [Pylaiella littoralis]
FSISLLTDELLPGAPSLLLTCSNMSHSSSRLRTACHTLAFFYFSNRSPGQSRHRRV